MFERIIVATDGSPTGNRAITAAADLAGKYNAELKVVHTLMHGAPPESLRRMAEIEHLVDSHPQAGAALDGGPAMAMSAAEVDRNRIEHAVIEAIGSKIVERAIDTAKQSGATVVTGETLDGEPAEKIIEASRGWNANLIVLGSRGLSGFKRLLLGSVSQKVTQLAECACLVVH